MLQPEERELVKRFLFDALNLQLNPRQFLGGTVFGTNKDKIPGEVAFLNTVNEYAEAVLTVCLRYGVDPPLLSILLDFLIQEGAGPLQAIKVRLSTAVHPTPAEGPYHDHWLGSLNQPFFDRAALRPHLVTLMTESTSPILRINAPDGTFGRTWTTQLIEHVAACSAGTVKVLRSDVGNDQGPSHQVTDLAEKLLKGFDAGPPPDRSSSSYPGAIARWILTNLAMRAEAFVMVLDGYGQPQLNPEVREAIDALATLLTAGEPRGRNRLVLLDYDQPLSVIAADVLEETLLPPEEVKTADIQAAIEAVGRARVDDGLEPIPPADVAMLATAIAAMAPPGGRQRLEALNAALTKMAAFTGPTQ